MVSSFALPHISAHPPLFPAACTCPVDRLCVPKKNSLRAIRAQAGTHNEMITSSSCCLLSPLHSAQGRGCSFLSPFLCLTAPDSHSIHAPILCCPSPPYPHPPVPPTLLIPPSLYSLRGFFAPTFHPPLTLFSRTPCPFSPAAHAGGMWHAALLCPTKRTGRRPRSSGLSEPLVARARLCFRAGRFAKAGTFTVRHFAKKKKEEKNQKIEHGSLPSFVPSFPHLCVVAQGSVRFFFAKSIQYYLYSLQFPFHCRELIHIPCCGGTSLEPPFSLQLSWQHDDRSKNRLFFARSNSCGACSGHRRHKNLCGTSFVETTPYERTFTKRTKATSPLLSHMKAPSPTRSEHQRARSCSALNVPSFSHENSLRTVDICWSVSTFVCHRLVASPPSCLPLQLALRRLTPSLLTRAAGHETTRNKNVEKILKKNKNTHELRRVLCAGKHPLSPLRHLCTQRDRAKNLLERTY
eukprot:Rhum_TRINITY_DN12734_c1_g1::Rhum_TRINITY_DN12734_c1_g1_i1::g.54170::m.54170